jgi:DUF1009 family protein
MPQFYFHLHDNMDVTDEEGKELPDLEAAHAYAMNLARFEVGQAVIARGKVLLSHRIDIEDEQGHVVGSLRFGDVVQIRP